MTTYRRPGGANWRKKGRGIVPTQAPFQGRKPGMVTGQQPQAAKPTLTDKKLNPAKYPTLETSPGVEKTNFGLPPLRGEDPNFDADVQKRRADAFEAARLARERKFNASGAGFAADMKGQDFIDKLRETKVDPKTFTGITKTEDHPLYKGQGTPNEPKLIDGKRNPNYVPPDTRTLYTGMYSPAWHHGQQNIQRADRLQKGFDEGKIMRPGAVGPAGHTKGGNFRQPANQWAIGNVEIRTENARKAGFRPIMGQVRDGTGRMVQDIIGYEKESDALRREALKMSPEKAVGFQTNPLDNPFTQTPERPGIDNAGGDVNIEPPSTNVGAQGQDWGEKPDRAGEFPTGDLDMPGFNPEPYPVDEVPGGSVSAPSGGVERVSPFGEEPSDVDLGGGRGMMIPDLQNVTKPSQDLPPRLTDEAEESNAEIFGGTNRPQPPHKFTPVPQSPNSTGSQDFTGPYPDADPGLPDMVGPAPEYEVEEDNPFDIQEGMQNPYSPDYDPSGVAPAQGEVPGQEQMLPPIGSQEEADIANPSQDLSGNFPPTMQGVGDKLKEENQKEIDDTGHFPEGEEHSFPPSFNIVDNDPAERRPMLPEIGSQEEADIANPPQDLPDNFPQSPPTQPNMEGAPPLAFPPQSGPVINAGGGQGVNQEALPPSPDLPGTNLEDIRPLPESGLEEIAQEEGPRPEPEYDVDDFDDQPALSPEVQEQANALEMQMQDMPEGPEMDNLMLQYEELLKRDQNRMTPAATELPWDQFGD